MAPNNSMQRTALRAAADAERWAENRWGIYKEKITWRIFLAY